MVDAIAVRTFFELPGSFGYRIRTYKRTLHEVGTLGPDSCELKKYDRFFV